MGTLLVFGALSHWRTSNRHDGEGLPSSSRRRKSIRRDREGFPPPRRCSPLLVIALPGLLVVLSLTHGCCGHSGRGCGWVVWCDSGDAWLGCRGQWWHWAKGSGDVASTTNDVVDAKLNSIIISMAINFSPPTYSRENPTQWWIPGWRFEFLGFLVVK